MASTLLFATSFNVTDEKERFQFLRSYVALVRSRAKILRFVNGIMRAFTVNAEKNLFEPFLFISSTLLLATTLM